MERVIAVLAGDGIGTEVTEVAVDVLRAAAEVCSLELTFETGLIGGAAIDETGEPLPAATLELCGRADATLLGAVGGPKWTGVKGAPRPEQGLLDLRRHLGVYANLRPIITFDALLDRCPLRPEIARGVDMLIVRELTGGVYFGKRERSETDAADECRYSVEEIERVARVAFRAAEGRTGRVASLDKANVLETSRLWRETVQRVHDEEFPAVTLEHHLIDSAAMRVIGEPRRFDVILTENMFGDIISDEASVLAGSLGLLGSASVAAAPSGAADHRGVGGLYEPIHGSAPDIAGLGLANPIGAILSAAMLLDIGLGESGAGRAVERAARDAMAMGVRSADLGGEATTSQIGATVTEKLCRYASLRM